MFLSFLVWSLLRIHFRDMNLLHLITLWDTHIHTHTHTYIYTFYYHLFYKKNFKIKILSSSLYKDKRILRLSLYNDDNKMADEVSFTFFCGTHRYEAGFTFQTDLPQQIAYMHGLVRRFCGKQRVSEYVQFKKHVTLNTNM